MPFASWDSVNRRSPAFDALGVPAALLDRQGRIVDTNDAWRAFAELEGAVMGSALVGVDFLEVCGRSSGWGTHDPQDIASGIRGVLDGERAVLVFEYPSLAQDRWILMRVVATAIESGVGAVVFHTDVAGGPVSGVASAPPDASIDPITSLPDEGRARRFMAEQLAAGRTQDRRVVVTRVDVLGLDELQQLAGPRALTQVLVQLSARARRSVRRDDLLCRMDDGAFVLIGTSSDDDWFDGVRERAAALLAEPYQVGADQVHVAVAVVQVVSDPSSTVESLLSALDTQRRRALSTGAGSPIQVRGPDHWSTDDDPELAAARQPTEAGVTDRAGLLDAVGEAVLVLDPDGRVSFLNRAAEQLYGWTADEARGRSIGEVGPSSLSADEVASILADVRSGRDWSGDLLITHRDGRRFPARVSASALYEGDRVVAIVSSTVDMTDRAEAEAEASHHATHDGLTDLPSRAALLAALATALDLPSNAPVLALLLDLDEFRQHNDALGLQLGDQLLRHCARVLRALSHDGDTVARFSGDSFAICCPHIDDPAAALAFAEEIRTAIGRPVTVGETEVALRSSAGVALSGIDEVDADGLLRQAEQALEEAKAAGRARTLVYDGEMRARLLHQVELELLVRGAVATGHVTLAYQPVIHLHHGTTIGAEALLRMDDSDGTSIPPHDAIAAAERCGVGNEFGRLVLDTACREAARWQRVLPEQMLTVSVNVSAGQLRDLDLPDRVRTTLAETGLAPSRLGLEISESVLMADVANATRQLPRLRMLGIRLSADDFGTGSSSLASLKRLPLDAIKADISFVAGLPDSPEDVAIVTAMIGVADALGLRMVAEGVENERQLDELRRLGCSFGQGYLWSRAVGGDDFLALATAAPSPAPTATGDEEDGVVVSPTRADPAEDDLDVVFRALAHEIRTPLTVIMGYASMLEATLADDDAAAATSIRRASDRIKHMISSLEDVRMIDDGSLQLEPQRLDVVALVRDLAADLQPVTGRPIEVIAPEDGRSVDADIDRPRIEQVLTNLVSNAVKFSPARTPIRITVVADEHWIDVGVADEGVGIGTEDLALVFRKYARVDRSKPGTGLGLYLARGTARAHGGDITYRHRRSHPGSVFTLRLPHPSARQGTRA